MGLEFSSLLLFLGDLLLSLEQLRWQVLVHMILTQKLSLQSLYLLLKLISVFKINLNIIELLLRLVELGKRLLMINIFLLQLVALLIQLLVLLIDLIQFLVLFSELRFKILDLLLKSYLMTTIFFRRFLCRRDWLLDSFLLNIRSFLLLLYNLFCFLRLLWSNDLSIDNWWFLFFCSSLGRFFYICH